jgi:hypothetical protein
VIEGGMTPSAVDASFSSGGTTPRFTFSAPAGSFYVRVHAVRDAFRSTASNEIQIQVNTAVAPSTPANLLRLANGSSLALAWTNTFAGGAPTSLVLDVTGTITTSLPIGFAESFTLTNVPAGTYTLGLRAENAAGSSLPSNAVTLTFPSPCSGPPEMPADMRAYGTGATVHVAWAPAATGPAPTAYVLIVIGASASSFITSERGLSGTVGPGTYVLMVVAVNACGASAGTAPRTVNVPQEVAFL